MVKNENKVILNKLLPYNIAHYILGEFISYVHQFKGITRRAGIRFENRDWHGIQADARERLTLYRKMVGDTMEEVKLKVGNRLNDRGLWRQIKKMYSEDVLNFNTREIAETFYNSVYRHAHKGLSVDKEMMFVLPSHEELSFRSVRPIFRTYSSETSVKDLVRKILADYKFDILYADYGRDVSNLIYAIKEDFINKYDVDENARVEMLKSVFYRNKCAYLIGRAVIGREMYPFVIPLLHEKKGLYVDSLLTDSNEIGVIFSYYRSYFLADIDIPGEYVDFLASIMPFKAFSELYNSIGFEKHGKTELYRGFLKHLAGSSDKFEIAPGIKGMVMSVFTLPSYSMVFKVIKDRFDPPKTMTKLQVKEKYQLVSEHDRVGRLADTHEFENFVFPLDRFSTELLSELKEVAPSLLEIKENTLEIKHLYAEKKMIPLNLYLEKATYEQAEEVVDEYGNAIKQLAAANIFPGDMLLKNFGVTRMKRVVFYDYDEIAMLTDCNFRIIPEARDDFEELASEPWYSVGDNDIFPEEFARFLIGDPRVKELFFKLHKDIFGVDFWIKIQKRIRKGDIVDVFPYRRYKRFKVRFRHTTNQS